MGRRLGGRAEGLRGGASSAFKLRAQRRGTVVWRKGRDRSGGEWVCSPECKWWGEGWGLLSLGPATAAHAPPRRHSAPPSLSSSGRSPVRPGLSHPGSPLAASRAQQQPALISTAVMVHLDGALLCQNRLLRRRWRSGRAALLHRSVCGSPRRSPEPLGGAEHGLRPAVQCDSEALSATRV